MSSSYHMVCLLLVATLACNLPQPSVATMEQLSSANTAFAVELYKQIRAEVGEGENIFFSPISISTAFAMLYAGARGNSETQMEEVLNFNTLDSKLEVHKVFRDLLEAFDDPTNNYTLSVANRLFGEDGYEFVQQFIMETEEYYHAAMESLDFSENPEAARKKINTWVAEKTMQKIRDLLPKGSVDELARLVLVNAIYFKGLWSLPFEANATRSQPFHFSTKKQIQIEMMNKLAKYKFHFDQKLGCDVLELPYAGEEVSMYVFIPEATEGLKDLEEKLTTDTLESSLDEEAFSGPVQAMVRLPKFDMTFTIDLPDILQRMGMVDIFTPDIADLSGINGEQDLYVSEAIHKAFVEVNEQGTEAAAATAIVVSTRMMSPQLFADRPFFFVIKEKNTNSILFMGCFAKPPVENAIVGRLARLTGGVPNSESDAIHFGLSLSLFALCLLIMVK